MFATFCVYFVYDFYTNNNTLWIWYSLVPPTLRTSLNKIAPSPNNMENVLNLPAHAVTLCRKYIRGCNVRGIEMWTQTFHQPLPDFYCGWKMCENLQIPVLANCTLLRFLLYPITCKFSTSIQFHSNLVQSVTTRPRTPDLQQMFKVKGSKVRVTVTACKHRLITNYCSLNGDVPG